MVEVGQRITWKAAGKVARLEGKSGQLVTGVVMGIRGDDMSVMVMPDHRTIPGAVFPNLAAMVEIKDIKKPKVAK